MIKLPQNCESGLISRIRTHLWAFRRNENLSLAEKQAKEVEYKQELDSYNIEKWTSCIILQIQNYCISDNHPVLTHHSNTLSLFWQHALIYTEILKNEVKANWEIVNRGKITWVRISAL